MACARSVEEPVAKKRREWSREFTPRGTRTVNLNITGIPPTLRAKFSAKCRRIGKSQRNLVLGWIRNFVEERRPDEDRPVSEPDSDQRENSAITVANP
jgi:hypothetical protein